MWIWKYIHVIWLDFTSYQNYSSENFSNESLVYEIINDSIILKETQDIPASN